MQAALAPAVAKTPRAVKKRRFGAQVAGNVAKMIQKLLKMESTSVFGANFLDFGRAVFSCNSTMVWPYFKSPEGPGTDKTRQTNYRQTTYNCYPIVPGGKSARDKNIVKVLRFRQHFGFKLIV